MRCDHTNLQKRAAYAILLGILLVLSACASAPNTVSNSAPNRDFKQSVIAQLTPPPTAGIRWGVVVTELDGTVLLEHNGDTRFSPASNTKLFTTALAFHHLETLQDRAPYLATHAHLEPSNTGGPPDLVLTGFGDPGVKTGPDCTQSCLSDIVSALQAEGIRAVGDVIGDAKWFPEARWPVGWSWEDLQWRYGTAISALSVQDNTYSLTLGPADETGQAARANSTTLHAYHTLHNQSLTVPETDTATGLSLSRQPGEQHLKLSGSIAAHIPERQLRLGVEDPAHYTAWRLKQELMAANIQVQGAIRTRQTAPQAGLVPTVTRCTPEVMTSLPTQSAAPTMRLPPPNWQDALVAINKDSQNLYAELILRQIGKLCGTGRTEDGIAEIDALLSDIGAPREGYDFFDGSGMSVYNRVSPNVITALLRYGAAQPWGLAWRNTFPIGGVDGGLQRRFKNTALEGKIFAKTGTLKGVNALSGYMIAASGKVLVFSIIANDRPLTLRSGTPYMDAALVEIAVHY